MSFTLEHNVGRLVEIVFSGSLTPADVQSLRTRLWMVLTNLPARGVIWADLRQADRFSPEVADKLLEMLRVDNPRVERAAYPIGAKAAFALQVERIVSDAAAGAGKSAVRRTFRELAPAAAWLQESLVETSERQRLAQLVARG